MAIIDYHLGEAGTDCGSSQSSRIPAPARALVYSAFADGALAIAALIAGADGLLGKHELGEEICNAISRVTRGQHNLPAISPSIRT